MKRIIPTIFAILAIAGRSFAQSADSYQVATLDHDGTLTAFYGQEALIKAHEAAADGDQITLSVGRFDATDITKAVTLHGAGMQTEAATNTILLGDFTIQIPDSVSEVFELEGVYHPYVINVSGSLKNAKFIKNRLATFKYTGEAKDSLATKMENLSFFNCILGGGFALPNNSSANIVNSVIYYPFSASYKTSNFSFLNCVIVMDSYGDAYGGAYLHETAICYFLNKKSYHVRNSSFINSFIATYSKWRGSYRDWPDVIISESNKVFSCLGGGYDIGGTTYKIFQTHDNSTTTFIHPDSLLSDEEIRQYAVDKTYKIRDALINKYLGYDSTQVGIYGGSMPFDPIPTYPQFSKFDIDAQARNGKLGVRVQILGTKEEEE